MSDARAAESSRDYRWLALWAAIIATGAVGIALKTPFGHFLMHVMGKAIPTHQTWMQILLKSEWGWLAMAALGTLLFYPRSGLSAAPWLERLIFPGARTADRPGFLKPVVIGALICTAFFAAFQIFGLAAPLTSQMSLNHISHADQLKLGMLYPLADIGAALSEEPIYRFGIISTLMGIMAFARIGGRSSNNDVAFWIANIAQAAWFGYIHVQQGIVTTQAGGIALETLISAPTWSGVVLGYVYRRWGIEAAIVTHMLGDILVPIFLLSWAFVHH